MTGAPSITLDDATVVLPDGALALDRVSLHVAPGEHVGVVGKAGVGKSTLLRAALGLQELAGGRVLIGDRDVASMAYREMKLHRRRTGLVFERRGLLAAATIAENVAYPLRYHEARGLDDGTIRERVRQLLAELDIEGHAGTLPAQVSDSVRKRALYARALALEPTLLLIDDAQGSLVEAEQALCARAIGSRRERRAITIIQTDHDGSFGPLAPGRIFDMEAADMTGRGTAAEAA